MDLTPTPEQESFRREVRAWLADHVPEEPFGDTANDRAALERAKGWERQLYEAGYAAISWPSAYGGRDADLVTQQIFGEEYARAGAPPRLNTLGLGLAGPTLILHGSEEQKGRWLPGILSADDIWVQGFSEPDAGSDLAALRTRAVLDADAYVVNGQKIWTSYGRFGDWMFTLVRTDPLAPRSEDGEPAGGRAGPDGGGRRSGHVPKHKGISYLMIDMTTPGIEVRPIKQINGDSGFAEVFLSDVRVPLANRVGEEGEGWKIAMATLSFERGGGLGSYVRFAKDIDELATMVRAGGRVDDPLMRDTLARLFVRNRVLKHNTYRTVSALQLGAPPGPEASLNKLYWSQMERDIFEAGMDVLGAEAELADAHGSWQKRYWYARAACIYAGTSQIQRNIISERVLGLPKEARA